MIRTAITQRATDGTETVTEFEPGSTLPVRTTTIRPDGKSETIDFYPDWPFQQPPTLQPDHQK